MGTNTYGESPAGNEPENPNCPTQLETETAEPIQGKRV